MKPEQYAKQASEFSQQVALFMWASLNLKRFPELRWYHSIKNEEKSGNVVLGARAKQSGIKKGVADTFLPIARKGCNGLYIEMKKVGGKPSKEQLEFGAYVQAEGYGWCVCDSWEKARDVLIEYLT